MTVPLTSWANLDKVKLLPLNLSFLIGKMGKRCLLCKMAVTLRFLCPARLTSAALGPVLSRENQFKDCSSHLGSTEITEGALTESG